MRHPFEEDIAGRLLVCDGGMGTRLYEQGLSFEISFDAVCLSSPKLVKNIHREYIEAGADIIETNSFGANRFRLEKHALSEKAHLINRTAAQLARQAREEMGRDVYVAGSIGPTGRRLFPLGPTGEDEIRDAFTAQVEGLLEGGIDIFMLETFADLNEINLALEAVRRQSDLPIVAQMSFSTELVTQTGKIPEDCVRFFADKQVTAFGANCSVGPQIMVEIIKRMSSMTSRPLTAQPNASLPKYIGGRYIYNVSPDYFAETMRELFDYGVGLVGGCCGTTPAHIQKLSQLVRQKKEKTPPSDSMPTIGKIDEPVVRERQLTVESSAFEQALRRKFVVSVELDPPRGSNPEKILKAAEKLAEIGVDAVNIADSPMARVRMAALAAAGLIKQNTELELILHMTGRDRNLMGLQSDLLGAYALGVRNILAVTGDPPADGDYPNVTAVYDVDSIGLLKIIEALNRGEDIGGNSIGYPTALCTGVAVNPGAENYHRELERFRTKESLNACFAMTQPLYRREDLERLLDDLGGTRVKIIAGLLPLVSHRHALFMHHEVPGIVIPEKIIRRMEKVGESSVAAGIEMTLELIDEIKNLVSGIYFMPSFGRYNMIIDIIKQSGLTAEKIDSVERRTVSV